MCPNILLPSKVLKWRNIPFHPSIKTFQRFYDLYPRLGLFLEKLMFSIPDKETYIENINLFFVNFLSKILFFVFAHPLGAKERGLA